MKIDKDTLADMTDKVTKAWTRLQEIDPTIAERLTLEAMPSLWFKTVTSISFAMPNPNILLDASGNRLFEHNHDYPMYPCDANDDTMQAAYKRIYKSLTA
jgi:hypothetical protein